MTGESAGDSGDPQEQFDPPSPPPAEAPFYIPLDNAERRQLAAALGVLVVYVLGVVLSTSLEPTYRLSLGSYHVQFTGAPGTLALLRWVAYGVPALLLCLVVLARTPRGAMANSLRRPPDGRIVPVIAGTAVIVWLLNVFGLLPFTWRFATSAVRPLTTSLIEGKQFVVFGTWVAWEVAAVPLIEEVAFRFGLLRYIAWKTGSARTAIVLSSILFAIGHLGNILAINLAHAWNSAGVLVLALVLGARTVRQSGSISDSVLIHAAANGTAIATLLFVLLFSS